jgi:hypothetical protein
MHPSHERLCALLGPIQPRPIQIAPVLSTEKKAHHLGLHLSAEEHEALQKGVDSLIKSGFPMNKSAFVRLVSMPI